MSTSNGKVYRVPALAGSGIFTTEAGAKAAVYYEFDRSKKCYVFGNDGSLVRFPMKIVEYETAETGREISWPRAEECKP